MSNRLDHSPSFIFFTLVIFIISLFVFIFRAELVQGKKIKVEANNPEDIFLPSKELNKIINLDALPAK